MLFIGIAFGILTYAVFDLILKIKKSFFDN